MTEKVISFSEEDSIADICTCLINNSFRRVPILYDGKLAGLITRADLIKAMKDKFKPQGTLEKSTKQQRDRILARDVMKCGLLTIRPQTPIYEAMDILATKNITGLPVVDDYMNLVGIVSEKDMLRLLYDPKVKPGKTEAFMTEDVISFNQNDSLLDICDCLMNNHFRRIPILNEGKIVGIISRADIIVYILKNKSDFFKQR
jgi:CBS domain-containing protein